MNSNVEIRIIEFRKNGTFKTRNILEETKPERMGKESGERTNPKQSEVTKLDKYCGST